MSISYKKKIVHDWICLFVAIYDFCDMGGREVHKLFSLFLLPGGWNYKSFDFCVATKGGGSGPSLIALADIIEETLVSALFL